ncbi:hypothetical protein LWI29_024542 [Acer saccharum]|uniref:Uncharacterized protein n=1 Tax=Acer saccharum TaxID=4024 RepID=A0AA39SLW0_ACESA|nr:hypothetical protein LWI29_024542 [Acer saccharum]
MRSLPDRFESKVTALEENSGYKDMKPSEDEKEEKKVDSDEDLALFVKRFNKVMKFRRKSFGSKGQDLKKKGSFKKFEPRQEGPKGKGSDVSSVVA